MEPAAHRQPLASDHAVGRLPGLKEPRLLKGSDQRLWLLWLEQRPQERGRTTALIRPFADSAAKPVELTPAPINLRSRVHDYGGGVLTAAIENGQLLLVWIASGCLWQQHWHLPDSSGAAAAVMEPLRLTLPGQWDLADGLLDLRRRRWLGIREMAGRDQLVQVSLDSSDQEPQLLHQPADFAGYAVLSADGGQLAWVEWQQPAMPWDSSRVWWSPLSETGELAAPCSLAGGDATAVFQPQWLPDGRLLVAEDSSGWWNLMLQQPGATTWERPWPMAAETAMPQWIYGMSTTAWDGEHLLAAVCSEGRWQLKRLRLDGRIEAVNQPFDDLAGLAALEGRAVAVASNSRTGAGLLELDLRQQAAEPWIHTSAVPAVLAPAAISVAEPIWFAGHNGQRTHAWYYPPSDGSSGAAPLLVKSHYPDIGNASTEAWISQVGPPPWCSAARS